MVTLTNGALTYQDEKQGTYQESVTVNGKTSWISTVNNTAIWYVPQFKEWAIGAALQIGTNWRGISSTGASEWDCPNLVPNSNWGYFNDAERALRGGGVRASNWLSKGRRFESRLRRFFTPTPAESLPFLTPPLAETVN